MKTYPAGLNVQQLRCPITAACGNHERRLALLAISSTPEDTGIFNGDVRPVVWLTSNASYDSGGGGRGLKNVATAMTTTAAVTRCQRDEQHLQEINAWPLAAGRRSASAAANQLSDQPNSCCMTGQNDYVIHVVQ